MFKNISRSAIAVATLVSLTVCANAQTLPTGKIEVPKVQRSGGIFNNIFGCVSPGSKQVIGAAGGSVIGGAVGNRVAGKGKRKIGTVIGAAVGAAVGSTLGCKLQNADKRRAEKAALLAAQTNQPQSWKNSETGASGTFEPATATGQLAGLTLAPSVQPATGYTGGAASYIATANANVRTMPNLDGSIVSRLSQGEQVWVAGAAVDTGWLLVAKDGVGKGYVSPALMQRQSGVAESCKAVRHTVSVPGKGSEVQNLRACLNADGNWVFDPAAAE